MVWIIFAWFMNLLSRIFGNTAKINMGKNKDLDSLSEQNWIDPDGIENHADVPQN